jgi:translation initiation factor 2 subunit 1
MSAAEAAAQKLPEDGEIVIATVREVTGHGAYVNLDEYNNMTGFLHISEIATGWIRNIERYVRPKQKAVLKVIRVNKARGEVDCSLKQVSGEERKSKLIEVKKNEKAAAFMDFIKAKLKLADAQVAEVEEKVLQKYDYVYDIFEDVARRGPEILQKLDLSDEIKKAMEEESNKIQVPVVEVRGVMEISSKKPDGIEVIKTTLAGVESNKGGAKTEVTYVGAPRYRIVVTAENFKVAEKSMNNTVEKVRGAIEKQHGTFNFIREESKKSHQG